MPPPFEHKAFYLALLPNIYFVKQLPISSKLQEDVLSLLNGPGFFSITRTSEEISIVGEVTDNPHVQSLTERDGEWRCIKIAGPMEFEITGVMCNFTTPLKAAGIPVYAVSTWNTDYVLVPKAKAEQAVEVLRTDGWHFTIVSELEKLA